MADNGSFTAARLTTLENLEAIQMILIRCVNEGMIDLDDAYYNEILAFIDEANLSESWDELGEVVTRSKTLEQEIAAWLSLQGRTTVSLSWPKIG